jgi:hypothetical protein
MGGMQKFLGLLFMAVGVYGMGAIYANAAYSNMDKKVLMMFSFILLVFGFIISWTARGK